MPRRSSGVCKKEIHTEPVHKHGAARATGFQRGLRKMNAPKIKITTEARTEIEFLKRKQQVPCLLCLSGPPVNGWTVGTYDEREVAGFGDEDYILLDGVRFFLAGDPRRLTELDGMTLEMGNDCFLQLNKAVIPDSAP